MSKPNDKALVEAAEGGGGGVSLGKGAWDCDTNTEIPPEKEVRTALFLHPSPLATSALWKTRRPYRGLGEQVCTARVSTCPASPRVLFHTSCCPALVPQA